MSELISELHALAQRMAAAGETDEPVTVSLAAEEIERLQQQNDYLSALASGQPLYGLEEKIAELMARNKALKGEVERLRAERDQALASQEAAIKSWTTCSNERNQLKDRLYKYGCEDVDVIRCLKTMAYEHNHSDVPRYKDLAKRTMAKYVERCTSVGSALAQHDAEVIEQMLSNMLYQKGMTASHYKCAELVQWMRDYANQLRQQAKESSDELEGDQCQ